MPRRATLAAIVLGLSCATAAAMGPDLSNLNGNPTDLRARAYADQGGRLRRGDTAPHAAQGRVQDLGRRAELARLLPSQAQGLSASESLLRRGPDLQSDPSRRERIPRRVVCRDRRPRQGARTARLPHRPCGNCEDAKDLAEAIRKAPKTQ